MHEDLKIGYRAFLSDGADSIGVIRDLSRDKVVIYVENAGDFTISRASVVAVHSQKAILDRAQLDHEFLQAVDHAHDREDPRLVG